MKPKILKIGTVSPDGKEIYGWHFSYSGIDPKDVSDWTIEELAEIARTGIIPDEQP